MGLRHLMANAWGVLTSIHAQKRLAMAVRRCWRMSCKDPSRQSSASPLQLDFGLTGPAISTLQHMLGLVPEICGFGVLSHVAEKVWCAENQTTFEEERMPPEELQQCFWQQFFSAQTQWMANTTPRHPDFRHRNSKPAWVDSQLVTGDAGMKRSTPESAVEGQRAFGRSGAHEGHVEVGMCRKLCEDGPITDAVDALNLLVQRGCRVPNNLFYLVLKRCKNLVLGRRIHALTIEGGYEGDAFLATHLIGMYASHGRLEEAMRVLTEVSTPSSYNWASIILGHARHGDAAEAVRLYRQMRESTTVQPTDYIYVAVLKACAAAGDLVAGKDVHTHILASPGKSNIFVQTGLVNMYANCGSLEDARKVFDRLPERDVVTWTTMIAGYTQQGMGQEALSVYSSMQQESLLPPDSVTFLCLLQACASVGVGALDQGKQLHAQVEQNGLQNDVALGGSLVNMYAKCGSLEDARSVFDKLPGKDVVTWNAMLAGYVQQGMAQGALTIYISMKQEGITAPDSFTFACLLHACASVAAILVGKQLHAQIEERGLHADMFLGTCLIDMYAKCGCLEDARSVFNRRPERDVVTWNAMLAGYAEQGMGQEALSLYSSMQQEGITPNSVTFVCLLQACAIAAAISLGKQLHAQIQEQGLQCDPVVGAALVNMYAKCGSMLDSQRVFNSLPERTIEAWGALAGGYSLQGDSEVVFDLLDSMTREGIQPNCIVFLSVLTVCSHVGLVEKGRKYFEAMRTDYGIRPTVEHYTCMMDLLGRAGHLDEALEMARTMPFPPNSAVWHTLLGACQKWNNIEIAQQAFELAVSGDGRDAASYVLMSNIYKDSQMWEEAEEMQARRVKSRAWKQPGWSWWTDMGGVVHTFVAGDQKDPESTGICGISSPQIERSTCAAS